MKKKTVTGSAILSCAIAFSAITPAQSGGGDFTITKSTIDAGGGVSEAGNFRLTGTIGQPDVSPGVLVGGQIRLTGGFWTAGSGVISGGEIFKDSFESP